MKTALCIGLAAAALLAAADLNAQEHVGRNLERGEPRRWSEPDDTPRKRHATAMKEARNALAETLRECRAERDRKGCESQAREQHAREVADARSRLARETAR